MQVARDDSDKRLAPIDFENEKYPSIEKCVAPPTDDFLISIGVGKKTSTKKKFVEDEDEVF